MEEVYLGIDVIIMSISMTKGIKGAFIEDDGKYLIYINCNLSLEQQKKAIKHELTHLIYDHLHSDEDLEDLEKEMDL